MDEVSLLFSRRYSIWIFHLESNDLLPFGSFFFQRGFYILDSNYLKHFKDTKFLPCWKAFYSWIYFLEGTVLEVGLFRGSSFRGGVFIVGQKYSRAIISLWGKLYNLPINYFGHLFFQYLNILQQSLIQFLLHYSSSFPLEYSRDQDFHSFWNEWNMTMIQYALKE